MRETARTAIFIQRHGRRASSIFIMRSQTNNYFLKQTTALSNLRKYFSGWLACSSSTLTALLNVRSRDVTAGLCLLSHFSGDCRGLKFLVHIQRLPSAQRIWCNALRHRSCQLGSGGSLCIVARDSSSMGSHRDSCLRRMNWNSNGQSGMDWSRALA